MESAQTQIPEVAAINSCHDSNRITLLGQMAYRLMAFSAKEQGVEDPASGLFGAPLNSIFQGYGDSDEVVARLKLTLKSMVSHHVEWDVPSVGVAINWGGARLLAQVELKKVNGEDWLYWAYPPAIRQEMLAPVKKVAVRRSTLVQFRTVAAMALYEICTQYKDDPSHMTSKEPWQWWALALRGASDLGSMQFRFFARDILNPAIKEVNTVSELTVCLHKITGDSSVQVESVQLEVRRKQDATVEPIDMTHVVRAADLGVDAGLAEEWFLKYGASVFEAAVDQLEATLMMPRLEMLPATAHLRSLLTGRDITPSAESVVLGAGNKNNSLRAREAQRVKDIRKELSNLDPAVMGQLLGDLKANFMAREMPPATMRRLAAGNWESALVLGELIRFYWALTRKTDWSNYSDSDGRAS